MSHAPHRRPLRTTAAVLTAALLGAGALAGFGASASAAQATPARVPAARHACARPAIGYASCLATFRSIAGARAAGTPANRAASSSRASAARAAGAVAPPSVGYGPADVKRIYSLPTSRAGGTIAIVDAHDNPNAESDLAAFRSAYGMSACTTANGCFRKLDQRGGTSAPTPDSGWGLEIDLDLQAASAACPRCSLLLVEADNESFQDLGLAVNRAVRLGAKIVSNSYGGDEFNGVHGLERNYYSHNGVAIVASSGDNGFGNAGFPASGPRSIAVGGTTVTPTKSGYKQTVWDGAGSGCSAWFDKPSWQQDPNCLMRTVADVSALADPNTGFAVYDTYKLAQLGLRSGWSVVGGTSLAAPLISGMIALAGNPGVLHNAHYIYQHASALHDVVGGSNAFFQDCGGDYLCTGVKGYDGPSGEGTPVGVSGL